MFLQPIAIFSQKLEGLRGHLGCVQVRSLSDKQRVDLKLRIGRLHLNSGGKKNKSIKFDFTKLEGICPIRVTAMLRYWQIDELLLGESQFCIFASSPDDNDVQLLQTPAAL